MLKTARTPQRLLLYLILTSGLLSELLVNDIERQLPHLEAQPVPVRDASNSAGFHH